MSPTHSDGVSPAVVPAPSPRQVLLGLFILGQLVFLVLTNTIEVVKEATNNAFSETPKLTNPDAKSVNLLAPGWPESRGHAWDLTDQLYMGLFRWIQLTGQDQNWSLFAPRVGRRCWFPALEIRWDDETSPAPPRPVREALALPLSCFAAGTMLVVGETIPAAVTAQAISLRPEEVRARTAQRAALATALLGSPNPIDAAAVAALDVPAAAGGPRPAASSSELFLSDNEPPDVTHYLRYSRFRLRRYECSMLPSLMRWTDETEPKEAERWSEQLRKHASEYGPTLLAYVRWRYAEYQRRYPEKAPAKRIILLERRYTIFDAEEDERGWSGPHTVPIAQWRPQAVPREGELALERYNPVTRHFEGVPR